MTLDDPILSGAWDDKSRSKVLLAAYIAGNAQSQLNSGVKQDDVYSGVLTMIAAYRNLQEADKTFKITELDKLVKLHQDGKLVAHCGEVEKALAKPKKKENQMKISKPLLTMGRKTD